MDLENLFIEKNSFQKVANHQLSGTPEQWDAEIIQILNEEHPYMANKDVEVIIKKADAKKGYAYGYIKLGVDVNVPLIIKKGEMSPLDVFLKAGSAYPLTKDTLETVLMKTDVGKPQNQKQDAYVDSLIYNRTMPPYDGKYTYANVNGAQKEIHIEGRTYGSILQAVDLHEDQVKFMLEKFAEDKSSTAAMAVNGTIGVIKEAFTHAKKRSGLKKTAAALRVTPRVRHDISIMESEVPVMADTFAKYAAVRPNGERVEGVVFPNVYDYSLNRQDQVIFKGDRCAIQEKLAGFKAGIAHNLPSEDPKLGDTMFFFTERGTTSVATTPVKVMAKTANDGVREWGVQDTFGHSFKIVQSDKVKNIFSQEGITYVPTAMKIATLKNVTKLEDNPFNIAMLDGIRKVGGRNLEIKCDGHSFSFSGESVKVSSLREGVTRKEALNFLRERYTEPAIKEAMFRAMKNGKVVVNDVILEEPVKVANHKIQTTLGSLRFDCGELIKCAAELPDQGVVDTVLSLNFINEENVADYVSHIPQYEKAASHLADLLIASRIGAKIEEKPIKTAMEALVKVSNALKMLRGTNE